MPIGLQLLEFTPFRDRNLSLLTAELDVDADIDIDCAIDSAI